MKNIILNFSIGLVALVCLAHGREASTQIFRNDFISGSFSAPTNITIRQYNPSHAIGSGTYSSSPVPLTIFMSIDDDLPSGCEVTVTFQLGAGGLEFAPVYRTVGQDCNGTTNRAIQFSGTGLMEAVLQRALGSSASLSTASLDYYCSVLKVYYHTTTQTFSVPILLNFIGVDSPAQYSTGPLNGSQPTSNWNVTLSCQP